MENELKLILKNFSDEIIKVSSIDQFNYLKSKYIGPNGLITSIAKKIKDLQYERRPIIGKAFNKIQSKIKILLTEKNKEFQLKEDSLSLEIELDPTLPSSFPIYGTKHPLTKISEEIVLVFKKLGFSLSQGPEIETEWFCFDALNTPKDHPARNSQDTFFLPKHLNVHNLNKKENEKNLLRSHTSSVQIRTMLAEKPPLRVLSPGRVFRRDTIDATHSANFNQVEGMCVDKNITIKDLRATIEFFLFEMFGKEIKTRLRPSFFPFTSPSFEIDLMSSKLGKLSNTWIEVMGCGIIHPNVFDAVNYNSEIYSGYAFGIGQERLAMLLYGIDDIRFFYQNDIRFLSQFY